MGDVGASLAAWTHAEDTLDQVARWMRAYHRAVADFVPPPGAVWREGGTWSPGLIIGHNDAAPYNAAWHQGTLAGFFDWDFAGPAAPEWDLAFAAFSSGAPARPARCRRRGIHRLRGQAPPTPPVPARIRLDRQPKRSSLRWCEARVQAHADGRVRGDAGCRRRGVSGGCSARGLPTTLDRALAETPHTSRDSTSGSTAPRTADGREVRYVRPLGQPLSACNRL